MLFSEWIRDHAGGDLDEQMGDAMEAVAEAVRLVGKAGGVTLKLSMEPKGRRLLVAGTVNDKTPAFDPESGLYFLGDDGLQKEDPGQLTIDDIETIDHETGEIQ